MRPLGPMVAAARSVWLRTSLALRARLAISMAMTTPMATSGTLRARASFRRMGSRI